MTTPDTTGEGKVFSPKNLMITALAVIIALIVGAIGWWAFNLVTSTKVHANFSSAVGIYKGSNVRVLGVDVGKVTDVTPRGESGAVLAMAWTQQLARSCARKPRSRTRAPGLLTIALAKSWAAS